MYPSAHYLLFVNYEDFFEEIKRFAQKPEKPAGSSPAMIATASPSKNLPICPVCSFLFCQAQTGSPGIPDQKCSHPDFGKVRTIAQCGDCLQFHTSGNKRCNRKRCTHRFRLYSGNEKTVTKGWNFESAWILSSTAMILKTLPIFNFRNLCRNSRECSSFGFLDHSVCRIHFKRMEKLYPAEPLFAGNPEKRGRSVSYPKEIEEQCTQCCQQLLLEHLPPEKLFLCQPAEE